MELPQEILLRGVWNLPVWPTPLPALPVRNKVPTLAPVHGCNGVRMLTAAEMAAAGPWRVPVAPGWSTGFTPGLLGPGTSRGTSTCQGGF
jgi:hypothetical protein